MNKRNQLIKEGDERLGRQWEFYKVTLFQLRTRQLLDQIEDIFVRSHDTGSFNGRKWTIVSETTWEDQVHCTTSNSIWVVFITHAVLINGDLGAV